MPEFLTLADPYYPSSLKKITGPPEKLYFKGHFDPNLFINCIAVVGSRDMTSYGEEMTRKFVYGLVQAGVTIVSGFMYGIDYVAHRSALDFGGKTIAVLAGGIENIQPYYHEELYLDIEAEGGLILSEFDGYESPKKWSFPRRNRIVAGLSLATLVIEAGSKSGTLITATYTFDQNKKVFVVPGNLNSKNSLGIIKLIQRGAMPVYDADEVLAELNLSSSSSRLITTLPDVDVLNTVRKEPMTFDELLYSLNLTKTELYDLLLDHMLSGQIIQKGGIYYACED